VLVLEILVPISCAKLLEALYPWELLDRWLCLGGRVEGSPFFAGNRADRMLRGARLAQSREASGRLPRVPSSKRFFHQTHRCNPSRHLLLSLPLRRRVRRATASPSGCAARAQLPAAGRFSRHRYRRPPRRGARLSGASGPGQVGADATIVGLTRPAKGGSRSSARPGGSSDDDAKRDSIRDWRSFQDGAPVQLVQRSAGRAGEVGAGISTEGGSDSAPSTRIKG